MQKHIGETRETVKPPYPSLTKIALTAPTRLHSLIPHRFHGSPRPSSMHPKTAPFWPFWAILTPILEQNSAPATQNAAVAEFNILLNGINKKRLEKIVSPTLM